jgi:predicted nucleic acid-binding protein
MTFADLPAGAHVFTDANSLIYHFSPHPALGPACSQFVVAVENQTLSGYTSTHVIGEVAHALMVVEAVSLPGWSLSNVPKRLKKQGPIIQQLTLFEAAVATLLQSRFQVLTISANLLQKSTSISRQYGLLTNDALIVAIMQEHGLTALASHDDDFDRVPWITRYGPA